MFKKSALKIILLTIISALLIMSSFTAFADEETPEIYDDEQTYEEPAYEEPTYEEPAYEEPTYEEEEPTYAPEEEEPTYAPEEEETYAPETEEPVYETEPETEEPYYEPETEAPAIVGDEDEYKGLPTAPTGPDPTSPIVSQGDDGDMTYGFVSWACVIVGALTVIVVLISNKTSYYSGGGKNRYDEGNKMTGQKHLLNDDYYNNRKYNSYNDNGRR